MIENNTLIPQQPWVVTYVEQPTLRDQFAMAALQLDLGCDVEMITMARKAYEMADAMLEARKEKK